MIPCNLPSLHTPLHNMFSLFKSSPSPAKEIATSTAIKPGPADEFRKGVAALVPELALSFDALIFGVQSPEYALMHARTHARAHARTHARTHGHAHPHTHARTHAHRTHARSPRARTRTHAPMHPRIRPRTRPHLQTTRPLAQTHAHARPRARTHTSLRMLLRFSASGLHPPLRRPPAMRCAPHTVCI